MGDWSKTVDATGSYGFNQTLNGQISLNVDVTGIPEAGWTLGKSTDLVDLSKQVFYLTEVWIACGSATTRLIDGSSADLGGGVIISAQCITIAPIAQHYDFRSNPILCLTADSTTYICISSLGAGSSVRIHGYWGAKPQ